VQAIDEHHAREVLHSLRLYGPLVPMAAATGVVLFASSLMAGWAENFFVLHRIDSAIRYNPRITAALGVARAQRWAAFLRAHISGLAANISLGMMMGLVPVFTAFFGLPIEVPHVTLSTGQIAVAAATLGPEVLKSPLLWWSVAAIPILGLLNVGVSFFCAFRLALRAHNVSGVDRARIRVALRARLRKRPMSFLLPE
jgi:site-specific recombinase